MEEVAGSCFCCNFNGFVDAIKNLRTDIIADVIIAEPVGSCADLSATIVNPLKKYHSPELTISPLSVLADPSRLCSILHAHGEAVLGWLNGTLHLAGKGFCWDEVLKDIMSGLTAAITSESLRVGHVKLIMECGKDYAVTNLTGADNQTTFRGKAGEADEAKLIINARVETSPEHIDELVRNVLADTLPSNCQEDVQAWRYLQPGRPNPTHRFNETV